jgi:hypothetical protein
MQDIDATITKEEAEIMFRTPKTNIFEVGKTMNPNMVLFMIKNYFLNFDKVEIKAVGCSIGLAVNAVKALEEEEYLTVEKLATDMVEEGKFKPVVSITVDKKNR